MTAVPPQLHTPHAQMLNVYRSFPVTVESVAGYTGCFSPSPAPSKPQCPRHPPPDLHYLRLAVGDPAIPLLLIGYAPYHSMISPHLQGLNKNKTTPGRTTELLRFALSVRGGFFTAVKDSGRGPTDIRQAFSPEGAISSSGRTRHDSSCPRSRSKRRSRRAPSPGWRDQCTDPCRSRAHRWGRRRSRRCGRQTGTASWWR